MYSQFIHIAATLVHAVGIWGPHSTDGGAVVAHGSAMVTSSNACSCSSCCWRISNCLCSSSSCLRIYSWAAGQHTEIEIDWDIDQENLGGGTEIGRNKDYLLKWLRREDESADVKQDVLLNNCTSLQRKVDKKMVGKENNLYFSKTVSAGEQQRGLKGWLEQTEHTHQKSS